MFVRLFQCFPQVVFDLPLVYEIAPTEAERIAEPFDAVLDAEGRRAPLFLVRFRRIQMERVPHLVAEDFDDSGLVIEIEKTEVVEDDIESAVDDADAATENDLHDFQAHDVTLSQLLLDDPSFPSESFEECIRLRRERQIMDGRAEGFSSVCQSRSSYHVFAKEPASGERARRECGGGMEPPTGFEPVTLGLRYLCSTS